ncbi:hypothetical protein ACJJTC_009980 [Scirpophaga incertulas]
MTTAWSVALAHSTIMACVSVYHLPDWGKLPSDDSPRWLCPECLSKKPRGDNSDTPVRDGPGRYLSPPTPPSTPASAACSGSCESSSELRAIIKEELLVSLRECVTEVKKDLYNELKAVRNDIGSLTDSINFVSECFEKLNTDIATCKSKIACITKENEALRNDLNAITSRINQIEQVSRASNIEIQCVPERKSENLICMVKQLGKNYFLRHQRVRYILLLSSARLGLRTSNISMFGFAAAALYMRKSDTSEYVLVRNVSTLEQLR